MTANASGKVSISGIIYPTTDGSNGQVLTTNGSGVLSFVTIPANQNLFATVSSDSGSTTANTVTDTLTVVGAAGVTTGISGDTLTVTGPNLSSYLQNLSGQNFTTLSDVATPASSDDGKVLYYDHPSQTFKYKATVTELDTLDTVLTRGNVSNKDIYVDKVYFKNLLRSSSILDFA